MSFNTLSLKSRLEKTVPSREGVEDFLGFLGYPLISEKEQLLDSDVLFQQKDMRERVVRSYKLFGQKAQWVHPVSRQSFDVEATVMLFELVDEQTLRSRWPFEITRYVVKFGLRSAQALFFFVAPSSRSFVVSAYTESLAIPERVQVRRLVVDVDNVARTDVESLAELFYSLFTPTTMIHCFRNALPYLKVGQAFFREYHNHFQILSKRLRKVFGSTAEAYGFAQRLLGRITFLYFLQRKGWLDKDRAYLKKRTQGLDGKKLIKFLYELFDILNTEGYEDKSKGVIPYLNGSLFEKERYSNAQMAKLMDACTPVVRDVLSVFDEYNFTISESTPLDKEVAVDPELLGSLFESMLPEAERGDKGTFYTHQEEMLFMAREALRVYLSRFPNLLTQEQVFYLVYGSELSEKQKIEPKVAREVKDLLRQIKILDPAVGSGGFLMAALQTILEVRARLNGIIGALEQAYDVKLETIENNLFGVDIEHEAMELARLRLWLTLVVDESLENIRPLPNLDYNLHQGDSLKIPEFEKKLRQIRINVDHAIRNALLKQITTTREEYSRAHGKEKNSKRQELENALRSLLEIETGIKPPKVLPFSYRYFFADVIANGGFDIILMNPPYIEQRNIGKLPGQNPTSYKTEIREDSKILTDGKFTSNKQSDISIYFHARCLSLLKDGGAAVVIATSKWLDAKYGVPLQEHLIRNSAIDCVYDSAQRSFSADVNTVITIMRRLAEPNLDNLVRFVYFKVSYKDVDSSTIKSLLSVNREWRTPLMTQSYRIMTIRQRTLYEIGSTSFLDTTQDNKNELRTKPSKVPEATKTDYVGSKWGNLFLRAPPVYYQILEKAAGRLKPIEQLFRVLRGTTSGADDFFFLKKCGDGSGGFSIYINGLGYKTRIEDHFCPPAVCDPEDTLRYEIEEKNLSYHIFMCREERQKLRGTYALKYIEWAETDPKSKVRVRRGKDRGKLVRVFDLPTTKSRRLWYQVSEIVPARLFLPEMVKNRHVIPMSEKPLCAADSFYLLYTDNPLDVWLYLNSSIFRLFMELNGRGEGAGALHMMVYEYKQCPIIHPMIKLSEKFSRLKHFKSRTAYRFINIAEQGPLELEQEDRKELDESVLTAMGFTEKEEREAALKEIYSWLLERVRERLLKPKTAPESVAKSIGRKRIQTDLREFQ